MTGAKRGLLAFLRDRAGNVLPIAAIGMLLSAALVGGGIDMSRAYRAQNRLQAACDSAVLAGRRKVESSGLDQPVRDQAEAFFRTNFNDTAMETNNTVFTPSSTDNGQTINASASTELKLAVMQIFGFQKFNLAVTCTSSMGVGNSDVVMVLDNTGSMKDPLDGSTRIAVLRQAMKNFYTTVQAATAGTNARIRYGFVPFSSSVNVGKLIYDKNPAYLISLWPIQSRKASDPVDTTTDTDITKNGSAQNVSGTYNSSSKCATNLPANTYSNNGTATTDTTVTKEYNDGSEANGDPADGYHAWTTKVVKQPVKGRFYECYKSGNNWAVRYYDNSTWNRTTATRYQMVYQQVTYDVSAYKAFQTVTTNTGDFAATVSSTWGGCIEERATVAQATFSFSTTTNGITPAANDLDIDSAPTSDDATKWRPMWPEVAYNRIDDGNNLVTSATSNYGVQAVSYCPYKAQLLTTMTQDDFNAYADALKPDGSTYLDLGMVWGGRLSSPDGIFKDNVIEAPNNGGEVSRHLIFMSDGAMSTDIDLQTSWGIEYFDRRVTAAGGSTNSNNSRHTSRFLALCAAIRAKGIRVWTISFTSGTSSDLQTCASPNSYYNALNSTDLNAAFQDIAKQVGELRLTQ